PTPGPAGSLLPQWPHENLIAIDELSWFVPFVSLTTGWGGSLRRMANAGRTVLLPGRRQGDGDRALSECPAAGPVVLRPSAGDVAGDGVGPGFLGGLGGPPAGGGCLLCRAPKPEPLLPCPPLRDPEVLELGERDPAIDVREPLGDDLPVDWGLAQV